jgi:hypothetical protein
VLARKGNIPSAKARRRSEAKRKNGAFFVLSWEPPAYSGIGSFVWGIEVGYEIYFISHQNLNKNKTKETQIVSLALQNSNKIKPKKHRPFLLALPFLFAKKR